MYGSTFLDSMQKFEKAAAQENLREPSASVSEIVSKIFISGFT